MEQKLKVAAVRINTPLDLLDRPVSAVLIIVIFGVLASALWGRFQSNQKTKPTDGS